MPHNIALLRADIEDELAKLEALAQVFATVREKLDLQPAEVSVYDRGAIGYLLHNFSFEMPEEPPEKSEDEEDQEPAPKSEGGWFWPGALPGLELGG
ncbi:hypothetical protein [Thiocapsa sp. UBA6158]|jgi:hypothetical protein|uniref:hypothetical protein n=1 Tax=Thiocapsa sp. UBA6158 TaxID=1947692 RepID=UPI0025CD2B27|nr:hypothetical protein [Thiocapsa sp. UBA6158]